MKECKFDLVIAWVFILIFAFVLTYAALEVLIGAWERAT